VSERTGRRTPYVDGGDERNEADRNDDQERLGDVPAARLLLAELQARPYLSPEQQWRESELKKLKLIGKDRMETMIRQNQAAPQMSA